jgi:phenylalanyl-tRNA synthetase alpha subunit
MKNDWLMAWNYMVSKLEAFKGILSEKISSLVNTLKNFFIDLKTSISAKINELAKQLEEYKPKLQDGYDKKKQWESKKEEILNAQNTFTKQRVKITHVINKK